MFGRISVDNTYNGPGSYVQACPANENRAYNKNSAIFFKMHPKMFWRSVDILTYPTVSTSSYSVRLNVTLQNGTFYQDFSWFEQVDGVNKIKYVPIDGGALNATFDKIFCGD